MATITPIPPEIRELRLVVDKLWRMQGGKRKPTAEYRRSVMETLFNDHSEEIELPDLEAEQVAYLEIADALEEFSVLAPVLWTLIDSRRSPLFRRLLRRNLDVLSRVTLALAQLDELEETA